MSLRVGVDFDNTIINYDDTFHALAAQEGWIPEGLPASKAAVKAFLVDADGNDLRWQGLQARAYGADIFRATPFGGFVEFLQLAHRQGYEVFVISHKSAFSHFDPTVNLRRYASAWLEKSGLLQTEQAPWGIRSANIFFESTLDEKLERMHELSIDAHIDDLQEVLEHSRFPIRAKPIWFAGRESSILEVLPHWDGAGPLLEDFCFLRSCPPLQPLAQYSLLKRSGNNRIFRVSKPGTADLIVKRYFDFRADGVSRAEAEFTALSVLWSGGVRTIPEPLHFNPAEQLCVFSRASGVILDPAEIGENQIDAVADFAVTLFKLSPALGSRVRMNASAGRDSLQSYVDTVSSRLGRIVAGIEAGSFLEAKEIVQGRLVPLIQRVTERFYRQTAGQDLSARLPKAKQMLSPSDFGFHNVLFEDGAKPTFIDFEYFGWDDPAKLCSDFFHNAGQSLSFEHKWRFLDRFTSRIEGGEEVAQRFTWVVDLVGIEWILIVLNVLEPSVLARRAFSSPSLKPEEILRNRLRAALGMVKSIEDRGLEAPFLTIVDRPECKT